MKKYLPWWLIVMLAFAPLVAALADDECDPDENSPTGPAICVPCDSVYADGDADEWCLIDPSSNSEPPLTAPRVGLQFSWKSMSSQGGPTATYVALNPCDKNPCADKCTSCYPTADTSPGYVCKDNFTCPDPCKLNYCPPGWTQVAQTDSNPLAAYFSAASSPLATCPKCQPPDQPQEPLQCQLPTP